MMMRAAGEKAVRDVLYQVAPIDEKDAYIDRVIAAVKPYVALTALQGAAS